MLDEHLVKITEIIEEYEGGRWQSADNLRKLLRELSSIYLWVTKINIEAAQSHNMEVYNFKGSNAAGNTFADLKIPELRMTRKILAAMDRVLNSMRSEISTINKES